MPTQTRYVQREQEAYANEVHRLGAARAASDARAGHGRENAGRGFWRGRRPIWTSKTKKQGNGLSKAPIGPNFKDMGLDIRALQNAGVVEHDIRSHSYWSTRRISRGA